MEEKKYRVYSMLSQRHIFCGTKEECHDFIKINSAISPDDVLHIVK